MNMNGRKEDYTVHFPNVPYFMKSVIIYWMGFAPIWHIWKMYGIILYPTAVVANLSPRLTVLASLKSIPTSDHCIWVSRPASSQKTVKSPPENQRIMPSSTLCYVGRPDHVRTIQWATGVLPVHYYIVLHSHTCRHRGSCSSSGH